MNEHSADSTHCNNDRHTPLITINVLNVNNPLVTFHFCLKPSMIPRGP